MQPFDLLHQVCEVEQLRLPWHAVELAGEDSLHALVVVVVAGVVVVSVVSMVSVVRAVRAVRALAVAASMVVGRVPRRTLAPFCLALCHLSPLSFTCSAFCMATSLSFSFS